MLLPGVMTMSIAPTVASIRSNNFATAEAQVVAYAAKANISYEAPDKPDNCDFDDDTNPTEITCSKGDGKYKMIAKRSFLLLDSGTVGLGVYADDDRDGTGLLSPQRLDIEKAVTAVDVGDVACNSPGIDKCVAAKGRCFRTIIHDNHGASDAFSWNRATEPCGFIV